MAESGERLGPGKVTDSFVTNEIELAWAAGFFDGEGCFHVRKQGGNQYGSVKISQADPEVLERFRSAVGIGHIYGPYTSKTKPMWYYSCTRREDVHRICELLKPYLSSIKLKQRQTVVEAMKSTSYRKRFLKPEQVKNLRHLYDKGNTSTRELAFISGLSQNVVWGVVSRNTYKDV